MASIKVKYRPSSVKDREGTIYYQVIHERKVRLINTPYRVMPDEWNPSRSMVTTTHSSPRKTLILSLRQNIHSDIERFTKIARQLYQEGLAFTADDIVDEFRRYNNDYTVFCYMKSLIAKFRQNGRTRTAETYTSTLNSFRQFRGNTDLMLDSLTSDIMEAFEAWHKSKGNTPNTISFYTRILRAVYNRAVEDDIITDRRPFRHVYTGVEKTIKRAIPLSTVRQIKHLDLTDTPRLDFARDIFIMSFYLRGISFIDLAYLKKSDLKNGILSYRRRKTGHLLHIGWTPEMQTLLNKYPSNTTDYLMPIITDPDADPLTTYRNVGYNINHNLKQIAQRISLTIPLTLYVARHSWASAAHAQGIPISVISEGMGHDSEATTRIYLASLETSVVDQANAQILAKL